MTYSEFVKAVYAAAQDELAQTRFTLTEYSGTNNFSIDCLGRRVMVQQETPLLVRAFRVGRTIANLDSNLQPLPMNEAGVAKIAGMTRWLLNPITDF
jgi:hypothetical protein